MTGIRFRSHWVAILCAAVFGASSPWGRAFQFDVFIGYGGVVREVGWFPVSCEVKNDGAPFTGTIEVTKSLFGSKHRQQRQRVVLDLPTGTRKRVVIPVFYGGGGFPRWDVRLYDEKGKLREERPRIIGKEVAWESMILGAIPRNAAGMPKFPKLKEQDAGSALQPHVGRLSPDQFPDTPIVLESLSAIYLNSERALQLTRDQSMALTSWVAFGGHLILAIEQPADVQGTEWLQRLCPFHPDGLGQAKAGTSFYDWLADSSPDLLPPQTISSAMMGNLLDASPRRNTAFRYTKKFQRDRKLEGEKVSIVTGKQLDGKVLLAAEDFPLVLTAKRGRGQVTVLTFSPSKEPFLSWENKAWFWAKLNRLSTEWFQEQDIDRFGGMSLDGVFGSLIESRQVQKLPVSWLLLLLAVYLVVIGPLDYWCLKAINRQMFTWVTFPVYVVLFSLLIYFIGYRLRAGDTEWSELHIIDANLAGEQQPTAKLRGRTYMSIYSPVNAYYNMHCLLPDSTFRSEFLGTSRGGQESGNETRMSTSSGMNSRFFVPVWIDQLYVADWTHTTNSPLTARLLDKANGTAIRFKNHSSQPVEMIGIVAGGRFHNIQGLAPGESRTEILPNNTGDSLEEFVQWWSGEYTHAVHSRYSAVGETFRIESADTKHHAMVFSFIDHMPKNRQSKRGFLYPNGIDLSPAAERGDIIILAYYPDFSLLPWLNQFEVSRKARNTLLRLTPLPPNAESE